MPTVAAASAPEAAPTPKPTPVALVTPEPTPVTTSEGWSESGLEYRFSLGSLSLYNGSPLSYMPFEMGWRTASGFRLRSGIEIFYYEGVDHDVKQPALGDEVYSYNMLDWRTSLLYVVPLPFHLRPLAGLSLEMVRGDRQRTTAGLVNPPRIETWGFMGPGGVLGLEYRGGPHWALSLDGRYTFSFNEVGQIAAADFGWHYLF